MDSRLSERIDGTGWRLIYYDRCTFRQAYLQHNYSEALRHLPDRMRSKVELTTKPCKIAAIQKLPACCAPVNYVPVRLLGLMKPS